MMIILKIISTVILGLGLGFVASVSDTKKHPIITPIIALLFYGFPIVTIWML